MSLYPIVPPGGSGGMSYDSRLVDYYNTILLLILYTHLPRYVIMVCKN